MCTIKLFFLKNLPIELARTEFAHPTLEICRRCVRGGPALALLGYGSFPWSAGVHSLCILLLRSALCQDEKLVIDSGEPPGLSGSAGSPAASLDLALSKQPAWLHDIFGTDRNGISMARYLIRRVNPERKRPGPVVLFINPQRLPFKNIEIFYGDEKSCSSVTRQILSYLENSWCTRAQRKAPHQVVKACRHLRTMRAFGAR